MVTPAWIHGYPESSGRSWCKGGAGLQLYPNLTFNGRCEAASRFYQECFHGSTAFMMTYENAPMDLPAPSDWRKKIFHATFALAEFMFAGSDAPPGQYQKPQGFALQMNLRDPLEAERMFKALAENGTVQMPLRGTTGLAAIF
jgi:PhnB protein